MYIRKATKKQLKAGREEGYVVAALLIFMLIAAIAMAGWLKLSSAATRTSYASKVRAKNYGQAEGALNLGLSWVRANSINMTQLFSQANFCTNFSRFANASYATNDPATGNFPVATRVKLAGTTNVPMLLKCTTGNCSGLGTTAFPNSKFYGTTTTFNTINEFSTISVGNNIVKVALVDAVPVNSSASSTVCPSPTTDFFPVYRVDAMTGNDAGSRVFGYVTGSLTYEDAIGFYGADYVDVAQACASDHFTGSTPDDAATGNFNAKCNVGSQGDIDFDNNWKSKIFGRATTKKAGGVDATNVCGTYSSSSHTCITPSQTCADPSCTLTDPFANLVNPFVVGNANYCSGAGLGSLASASYPSGTLNLSTPGCYQNVVVPNNKTLNLTSPNTGTPPAYYFQTFDLGGGKGTLGINPAPATARVELHIKSLKPGGETVGCSEIFNGNNSFNLNNSKLPSQFKVVYWGICNISFSGNSKMAIAFYAPNANVTITGSADFYGAVYAKSLSLTGSGKALYDESLGGSVLLDSTYKLRNVEETYR